jgi:hypothetical protein
VKILGGLLVSLATMLAVLRITGLEPHTTTPGLWLKGDLVTEPVSDWSFADKYRNIMIQTNTWYLIPHSVRTDCFFYNHQLYVASPYSPGVQYPHGTIWNEHVARDPHVLLKIGNQLYDRTLMHVTDPAEVAAVLETAVKKYPNEKKYWTYEPGRDLGPCTPGCGGMPNVFRVTDNN